MAKLGPIFEEPGFVGLKTSKDSLFLLRKQNVEEKNAVIKACFLQRCLRFFDTDILILNNLKVVIQTG